jgi:hypothetical protein
VLRSEARATLQERGRERGSIGIARTPTVLVPDLALPAVRRHREVGLVGRPREERLEDNLIQIEIGSIKYIYVEILSPGVTHARFYEGRQ